MREFLDHVHMKQIKEVLTSLSRHYNSWLHSHSNEYKALIRWTSVQEMNLQSYCHITFTDFPPRLHSQDVMHLLVELSVIS